MGQRIILSVLAIVFGIFMIIYGGYDDSPRGQLLGLIVVIIGIAGIIRRRGVK